MIHQFKNLLFILLLLCSVCHANTHASTNVHHLRLWASPESTRVVLDLSQAAHYKTTALTKPNRLVIDIDNAHWSGDMAKLALANTGILKISHESKNTKNCRIIIELESKIDHSHKFDIFLLKPNEAYGHRLVIDVAKQKAAQVQYEPSAEPKAEPKVVKTLRQGRPKEFVVAIDPGHGGEDSGAVGLLYGTQEKDVVLAVSKKLDHMINAQAGMRAVLIRDGDYYLGLRKRMTIARAHHADVFVSIHADSFNNTRAHGASTFVLSRKGASSEAARWLAEHENRSDLIGGVSLEDKGNMLASVLLDLSQTANQSASEDLADELLVALGTVGTLHHRQVQKAGFMVLKSPDIPSVLVELGFLSHKEGEAKLRHADHQTVLARTVFKGIQRYLDQQLKYG